MRRIASGDALFVRLCAALEGAPPRAVEPLGDQPRNQPREQPDPAVAAWPGPGALRLLEINRSLWVREEQVRDRSLPDPVIVALKRQIDALNLERHAAIRDLDDAADRAFGPQAGGGRPDGWLNSESVGQMADRLTILALKRAAQRAQPAPEPARLAHLAARVEHLVRCLDAQLAALAEGRAFPQAFDEAKTYSA